MIDPTFLGDDIKLNVGGPQALNDLLSSIFNNFEPPKKLTVSEWAEEHRYVPQSTSSVPGPWRNSTNPPLIYPMECATNPDVSQVVLMIASQVGKTEILLNIMGFYLHVNPGPMLWMFPTDDAAKKFVKERVEPMIAQTKVLNDLIPIHKKSKNNNIDYKALPGDAGYIVFVGANMPNKLASRPIKIFLADELDRATKSSEGEGSPLSLARRRQSNFPDRKEILASTPVMYDDYINVEFEKSSQHRFHVPCPSCRHKQHLRFEQIQGWKTEYRDKNNILVEEYNPSEARYTCEECGVMWDDIDRYQAIADPEAEWIPTYPDRKKYGFHLPRFSSPFCKLSEVIEEYISCKDNPLEYQVFVNTVLAEPWTKIVNDIKTSALMDRREDYPTDQVPENCVLITGGVDVQKNRLEAQIIAWAPGEDAYVLDNRVFYGNPEEKYPWQDLERFLKRSYYSEYYQTHLYAEMIAVDSRFLPDTVHRWCYGGNNLINARIFATMGTDSMMHPLYKVQKKQRIEHMNTYTIGTYTGKYQVRARWTIEAGKPGRWHFPAHLGKDYFDQLTAEQLVVKVTNGYIKEVFEKKKSAKNEAFDTAVLNYFALRASNYILETLAEEMAVERENKELRG